MLESKREASPKLQPMTSSLPWGPVSPPPGMIAHLIPGSLSLKWQSDVEPVAAPIMCRQMAKVRVACLASRSSQYRREIASRMRQGAVTPSRRVGGPGEFLPDPSFPEHPHQAIPSWVRRRHGGSGGLDLSLAVLLLGVVRLPGIETWKAEVAT